MYDETTLQNQFASFAKRNIRAMSLAALTFSILAQMSASAGAVDHSDDEKATAAKQEEAGKSDQAKQNAEAEKSEPAKVTTDKDGWSPLFNGKDLEGWKVTNFGGEGDVIVENGEVVISQGVDLSGIHTEQKLPKSNYEIQFEAMRERGSDFFAGVTFPVQESHCSLILGGWGGGVCGISSLDGMDASENETTSYQAFDKGKWYKVRIEVRDDHLNAWLDDKSIVDVETTGMRISTRFEVDRSKPFGFATYATTGRIRNARVRPIPAAPK